MSNAVTIGLGSLMMKISEAETIGYKELIMKVLRCANKIKISERTDTQPTFREEKSIMQLLMVLCH